MPVVNGQKRKHPDNSEVDKRKSKASKSNENHDQSAACPFKLFATEQDRKTLSSNRQSASPVREHCQTLSQMLGIPESGSAIEWIVISNFMIEPDFLLDEVPELISCPKIIIFYEHGTPRSWPNTEFIRITPREEPSSPSNPTANPLRYQYRYGTHHTKMFLVGFKDRLRVIIHTANLIHVDIYKKAQGAYIQDFPYKSKQSPSRSSSEINTCDFEKCLIGYMESYGYKKPHDWISSYDGLEKITLQQQLSLYDFTAANVVLIPSIPGYYSFPDKCKTQGYMKLKSAVEQHVAAGSQSDGQVICQFSSIGALSEKWLREFVSSISIKDVQHHETAKTGKAKLVDLVKLVYPTVEEIELSIEGFAGGNSVPGKKKNVEKSFLKPLYCKWASFDEFSVRNPLHKKKNVPHIKSYYQLKPGGSDMEWFMMGSQNLSKAAWGEIINGKYGKCLRVLSWELGVFVAPSLVGGRLVPFTENSHGQEGATIIPLPYALNPERYSCNDKPWTID